MPIKHSALRQIRRDRKRHQRNQAVRAELKTLTKQLVRLLREKKTADVTQALRAVVSKLDRAASKGILHRNTASRSKARLAQRVQRAAAAASS
jgi:small subunit ribosomal protein S20